VNAITENLDRLAALLADGLASRSRPPTSSPKRPSAQAPEALGALGTTHTQGKLAVRTQ